MLYQTRQIRLGGGAITPAVKFLLIVNVGVFVLQLFFESQFLLLFRLVPQLVWQDLYLW